MQDTANRLRSNGEEMRPNHTLHSTALVHEVYIKLIDQRRVEWKKP
jgi:hypothetical protein